MTTPGRMRVGDVPRLAEAVKDGRARPWMHVTSDGQAHFYVRRHPHDPADVDMAKHIVALVGLAVANASHGRVPTAMGRCDHIAMPSVRGGQRCLLVAGHTGGHLSSQEGI